jgi:tRNA nucleotidyltransferase (CCA-adding enzyme)
MIYMSDLLQKLAEQIHKKGGTLFSVGGSVRDELLGRENKDLDVECFGLLPNELGIELTMFAATHSLKLSLVGKSFQVWKLRDNATGEEIDISLPRRDRKTGEGHKGFEVTADPFMSTKKAQERRDFTINAMMRNLNTGELIDHFGGQKDLENKVIRMVDENAFREDPLRVLRAAQFSGRFGFWIEDMTFNEMEKVDLSELPAERIFGELEKLLLKAEQPSLGLKDGVFPFPELEALRGVQQDPTWHPEGDCHIHSMMVVDEAAKLVKNLPHEEALTVMLAALAHDFGKATTTEMIDGKWKAHGHDKAGVPLTEAFLDRLNVHTVNNFDVREQVLALVENHLAPVQLFRANEKGGINLGRALRRLSQKVRLDLLGLVSLADMLGRGVIPAEKNKSRETFEWFMNGAKDTKVEKKGPEPLLKGRHLIEKGFKPGKEMGELLKQAFELQLDGKIVSLEQALHWVSEASAPDDFDDFAVPSLMIVDL